MKRIVTAALMLWMLFAVLSGCAPVGNDACEPEVTPSGEASTDPEPTPSETAIFEPTAPTSEAKDYYELKAEFERIIELAYAEEPRAPWGHADEIRTIFEEMLNYRQSVDDYNESMDIDENRYMGWINVWPVFTDGETNYRILEVYVHGYVDFRVYMYIQIYDETSIESHCIYMFMSEFAGIAYCDFRQESNKTYLIIIKRQTYPEYISNYFLVNYEISGKEVRNYNTLKEEFTNSIWTVSKDVYDDYFQVTRIEVDSMINKPSKHGEYSQWSFEDNILTITLDNEAKDEISLLFKDGFWEVVGSK